MTKKKKKIKQTIMIITDHLPLMTSKWIIASCYKPEILIINQIGFVSVLSDGHFHKPPVVTLSYNVRTMESHEETDT